MYKLRFQHKVTQQWFEEEYTSVIALLEREEELSNENTNFSLVKVTKLRIKTTRY